MRDIFFLLIERRCMDEESKKNCEMDFDFDLDAFYELWKLGTRWDLI